MRLDTDNTTPDEDKGPHYEPFDVLVRVTLDRSTVGRYTDREAAADGVLQHAMDVYNDQRGTAHSLCVVQNAVLDDDPNDARMSWGVSIMRLVEGITGVDRESTFGDAVSYLLHAELMREHEESDDPKRVTLFSQEMARDLLDAALRSFEGDHEDGPYAWEPSEDDEEEEEEEE